MRNEKEGDIRNRRRESMRYKEEGKRDAHGIRGGGGVLAIRKRKVFGKGMGEGAGWCKA